MLLEILIGFGTSVAGGVTAYYLIRRLRRVLMSRAARRSLPDRGRGSHPHSQGEAPPVA
jgi:hypothetical protein